VGGIESYFVQKPLRVSVKRIGGQNLLVSQIVRGDDRIRQSAPVSVKDRIKKPVLEQNRHSIQILGLSGVFPVIGSFGVFLNSRFWVKTLNGSSFFAS
jgi:hypothetical protein